MNNERAARVDLVCRQRVSPRPSVAYPPFITTRLDFASFLFFLATSAIRSDASRISFICIPRVSRSHAITHWYNRDNSNSNLSGQLFLHFFFLSSLLLIFWSIFVFYQSRFLWWETSYDKVIMRKVLQVRIVTRRFLCRTKTSSKSFQSPRPPPSTADGNYYFSSQFSLRLIELDKVRPTNAK